MLFANLHKFESQHELKEQSQKRDATMQVLHGITQVITATDQLILIMTS